MKRTRVFRSLRALLRELGFDCVDESGLGEVALGGEAVGLGGGQWAADLEGFPEQLEGLGGVRAPD